MNSDVVVCPRTLLKMLYLTVIEDLDISILALTNNVPAYI